MLLTSALVLGIMLGLMLRMRLVRTSLRRIKGEGLFFALLVAEALLPLGAARIGSSGRVIIPVWLLIMACLVGTALYNFRYPGMLLVALGIGLNGIAIVANGAMPVSLAAVSRLGGLRADANKRLAADMFHEVLTGSTRMRPLCDFIPVPGPEWMRGVVSVGDLMLLGGAIVLVACLVSSYSPVPK